jgi:hypothetical protein
MAALQQTWRGLVFTPQYWRNRVALRVRMRSADVIVLVGVVVDVGSFASLCRAWA